MTVTVAAVLKSGGDFDGRHGRFLERQVRQHYPEYEWRLYSDMDVGTHALRLGLPRWWSKQEVCADESLRGPVLLLDLDVVILQPWMPPEPGLTIAAADFNRITLPGMSPSLLGGFLYLQEHDRALLAADFFDNPIKAMATANSDDQPRLGRILPHAIPVQRIDPDAVVLYKTHVLPLGLRPENKIVLFHGEPRPWDSGEPWVPSLEV